MHGDRRLRHRRRLRRPRRGVALLLVLVALILGVTAATVAASALAVRSLAERQRGEAAIAARGLVALDAAVAEWLRRDSGDVVLPPDAIAPSVTILDETVVVNGVEIYLRATAFDQRGMVPWESVSDGAAIAGGGWVSDEIVDRIREASPPRARTDAGGRDSRDDEVALGLDLLRSGFAPVFPTPSSETAATVRYEGAVSQVGTSAATRSGHRPGVDGPLGIGALVATHVRGEIRLNVNTTPIALLARAGTLVQMDVAGTAAEARALGRKAVAPTISPVPLSSAADDGGNASTANGEGDDAHAANAIRFVAESDRWSVLSEATVGTARLATWSVHARGERGWIVVQRLRADGGSR